jgi:hypothetical protein
MVETALNKFAAFGRAATAWELALVMRVAIVTSKLVPGLYVPHGVEFRPPVGDAGEDVGIAGMIHELKRAAVHAAINGLFVTQFNDGDPLLPFCSLLGLGDGDSLSGVFANLCPHANGSVGVEPRSLDPAFSDDEHSN